MQASETAHDAARQTIVRAYEDQRVGAVAALETLIAHAQLALAAMKWDPEDYPTIVEHVLQVRDCHARAFDAIEARLDLAQIEGDHRNARAAAGAPASL